MTCPNFKLESVRKEFAELKDALGEDLAYLAWGKNNGQPIYKAANGQESKLFSGLLSLTDKPQAIKIKTATLTKSFQEWFDDSKQVDENKEPLIKFVQNNKFVELENLNSLSGVYAVFSKEANYNKSAIKLIFNSDIKSNRSDYDDDLSIKIENRAQTQVDGSMATEIVSNFDYYFPDYSYFNEQQRNVIADMVERGKIQITCKF